VVFASHHGGAHGGQWGVDYHGPITEHMSGAFSQPPPPIRALGGDIEQAVGYMSLEFNARSKREIKI
jgi:hypothetical protein